MSQCALETAREMGWAKEAMLPVASPSATVNFGSRFKDEDLKALAGQLSEEELGKLVQYAKA